MTTIEVGGTKLELDENGFLKEPEKWTMEVAKELAKQDSMENLSEDHLKIIGYIREYFQEFGIAPMVKKLCRKTGFSSDDIYKLFPAGPAKGACRIAGLPEPTGCV
jgi:tRNA 2-thiouridine synthesizing protein E